MDFFSICRCELEYQKLQIYIHEQTRKGETPTEDEEFVDAVTSVRLYW